MSKKSVYRKKNQKNQSFVVILIIFVTIFLIVGIILALISVLSRYVQKDNKQIRDLIVIRQKKDDYNTLTTRQKEELSHTPLIPSEDLYLNDYYLRQEVNTNLDDFWVAQGEYYFENNSKTLVYVDPINHIKFKDHSYGSLNGENRFLLNKKGLALLAREFYQRVNFGPEIIFLDAININDFRIINKDALGLYLPLIANIYINASFMAEKQFNIFQKVKFIIPTLFHEYMHHWASSYVSYGNVLSSQTQRLTYRSKSNPESDRFKYSSYFYKPFVDKMKHILAYDDGNIKNYPWYGKTDYLDQNNKMHKINSNFVPRYFTNKDLFDYANTNNEALYRQLSDRMYSIAKKGDKKENKRVEFSPYNTYNYLPEFELNNKRKVNFLQTDYNADYLVYYYSMTELIPSQWEKYNYIPYYQVDTLDNDYINSLNEDNRDKVLQRRLQDFSYHQGDYYATFQNYYGTGSRINENNGQYSEYIINSYNADWSRTARYALSKPNTFKHKSDVILWDNPFYENANSMIYDPDPKKRLPIYKRFYKLFLESMGYGKAIAQVRSKLNWRFIDTKGDSIYIDDRKAQDIAITGYLNMTKEEYEKHKYKYLVFKNKNNTGYEKIKLNYLNYMNFRGKLDKSDSRRALHSYNVLDELKSKKFVSYYTDYFNRDLISATEDRALGFWNDKNEDGKITNNELVYLFDQDPLPQRYVLNSHFYKLNQNDASVFNHQAYHFTSHYSSGKYNINVKLSEVQ